MGINFLSNKGSIAPIVYLLIQIFILTGIVITCPNIVDFGNSFFVIFFWLNIIITVGLFFYVHFLDPGYVPQDGVFFTEQEEPPLSVSHSHQLKYDSMMKLKHGDSKNMSQDFNFSPMASDLRFKGTSIMTSLSKAVEDKAKSTAADSAGLADSNVNLRNSTNLLSIGSPLPDPIKEEVAETPQSYDERYKNIENEVEEPEEDRVDVSLSHEEVSQEDDITDLDAVIVEEKDGTKDTTKQQPGMDTLEENEDDVLDMNDLRMKTEEYIASNQRIQSPTGVQRGIIANGLQGAYKGKYMMQLDDIVEEGDGAMSVGQDTQNKIPSPKKRYETFGQVKTTLQPEQCQYSAGVNSAGLGESLNQDQKLDKKQKTSIHRVEDVVTKETRSSTGFNGFFSGRSAADAQAVDIGNNSYSIKLTIGDYNNMRSLVSEPTLPKGSSDHTISGNQNKKSENELSDNELYIERRYCTACNLEQPLRSKHCRDCKRCVGRYDHHCPWVGTCIGELNHLTFCVYLTFQFIEIIWGEILLAFNVFENSQRARWSNEDIWRVMLLLATTFFLCLVGSLIVFHFYIATQNLTTWEYLSWNKISYLKEWNTEWGSPFTRGISENVKYFFSKKKNISRWKMPKYRAPLGQQEMIVYQDK